MQHTVRVEIYTKAGCSLCEKARAVLGDVQRRIPFTLVEVDISLRPALWEAYRLDIPVVTINGERAFHHRVDPVRLEALLVAAGGIPVAPSGDAK